MNVTSRPMNVIKRAIYRLPLTTQQALKRLHFARQMRRGMFTADDPEYDRLHEWVHPGDWVIDLGANVGHYTARLSTLVGASGRVFALEPVPETFEILAANTARFPLRNVTILNVAASDATAVVGMAVPTVRGLVNRYQAQIAINGDVSVVTLPVDALGLPSSVSLIKIDVEGHELHALNGMHQLLTRDHPVLIVEGHDHEVAGYLRALGYSFTEMPGSPNRVFHATGAENHTFGIWLARIYSRARDALLEALSS